MRFLIVDTYYPAFMQRVAASQQISRSLPYTQQLTAWLQLAFGTGDFYSRNLQALGHGAEDVIANCAPLQAEWAREHAIDLWIQFPLARVARRSVSWFHRVLRAQISRYRPDVLYVQDMHWVAPTLLHEARSDVRLIVGQIASPVSPGIDARAYDLILTSFPHFVDRFRAFGVESEYLKLAFESTLLERIPRLTSSHTVAFVGGFADPVHNSGTRLLEEVAEQVPVDFWGFGVERLSRESPIRQRYHGEAWGLDMYAILRNSSIALNRHSTASETFANNMRLYEATGVGALLVTDAKQNLADILEPNREVVTYTSAAECAEKVAYYLAHPADRQRIAAAGQQRTIRDHNYSIRMREMVEIVGRHIR